MRPEGPHGHILIEVDDLAAQGDSIHDSHMATLQKRIQVRKWKSIYGGDGDYAGRTIAQSKDYSFNVHQANLISERLKPIEIACGRRSNKTVWTTPGEQSQLRAVYCSINWVQHETRPDVSGLASLGMSRI